ncbi:MAG: hypothetical protein COS99_06005 [Candidatus Omnitrophica bacterium CG07_land_8_20_14_0_80_42_15]|uniref:Uncharacterized protein n=1 Tax=Candidatus Aquitaenariimonas noxiae TaxID=1974741 RepID=A0A2J0L470_9BACT|nr:MAG: hypothetical protein COS99_06005 [Candidatus Omnitrophica bacterium CG07_land_8_20_14_0_80_42_15]
MPEKKEIIEEAVPIIAPLKVLEYKTVNKRFGWWSAVVLVDSWSRKQVCLYLWQKKGDKWARKQKFAVHSQEDWNVIKESVDTMIPELIT